MIISNVIGVRYFIKKDGIITEVTEEKYNLFKKKLEMLNKQYLCPNCKETMCEKIRYSDINRCEEVNTAVYELIDGKYIDKNTGKEKKKHEVEEFIVFDCNKLDLYSHLVKEKNGTIRSKTETEKKADKKTKMNEKQNTSTKENIKKLPTNKEILESVRNKVKEENEMKLKLVCVPYPEGIELQTTTNFK